MNRQIEVLLDESELPRRSYNIIPDLSVALPLVLHPATHEPVGPEDLEPLFPMALIQQEVTQESYIDIPDEVLDVCRLWRPISLFRARRLEKAIGTPARLYYKYAVDSRAAMCPPGLVLVAIAHAPGAVGGLGEHTPNHRASTLQMRRRRRSRTGISGRMSPEIPVR